MLPAGYTGVRGIGGVQTSFGSVILSAPFPNFDCIIDLHFSIINDPVPTLMCLKDLKRTGFGLDIQNDTLFYNGKSEKLTLRNGLLWYTWTNNVVLYTDAELVKLHQSFGHASSSALYNFLKRANPTETTPDVRKAIEALTEKCFICAKYAQAPKRFKLTLGHENGHFNLIVSIDIMFIKANPVLHAVDEATHFCAVQ